MPKFIGYDQTFKKVLEDIDNVVTELLPNEEEICTNFDDIIKKQTLLVQSLKDGNNDLRRLKIESEKLNALHMLFWSNALRMNMEKFIIEGNHELINESIFISLMLGIYRGMFFSYQREDHFEFLTKLALSDAGRINRKQGHESRKKTIEYQMTPFLNEAEEKWRKGDQAFHDQMAQYLIDKHPEIICNTRLLIGHFQGTG
ncbi:hypothetical protein G3N56_11555 [Desulfovibrio sulfodismutans]|uniref:Uncharacterized protein n=1 Tax=Desulfolutivibrio sulfodismutans TaxID=63561 RepID=A0A7K3NMM6_9BACT|nr:hypothetical protein [Desulfolutivibrio sulfodismutans]NDY57377.1 hypothetical protein [Desulfolutivibrio sulfodismutans]QLA12923.1 hypothetical protein GD606_11885 [Desulfolutivibrio sulfodismutans DSM 3696]